MDPVSLSLILAGILPVVAATINYARNYKEAMANRSKSIASMITELKTLEACLERLTDFLNHDVQKRGNLQFDDKSVLQSCCLACTSKLKALYKKLGEGSNGKLSRFMWPPGEKEHEKTLKELRNFTSWMQFALSIDGCRLLSRTREDVLCAMGQQLENFKTLPSIEIQSEKINGALHTQTLLLKQSVYDTQILVVLDWISTMKHGFNHSRIRGSRTTNTGLWLLQRKDYLLWRNNLSSQNILW